MKKIFGKSRGQMMVLYAGIIATLIGAVALGTDVAVMYVNWQQVQKAADAGAVAGAIQFLPTAPAFTAASGCGGNLEQQAACTYALKNSATLSEISGGILVPAPKVPASVPAAYASQTVQVTVHRTDIPVFFGRALGMTTPFQASATAIAVGPIPLNGARNPFPAGIPADPNGQPITYGTQFSLTNADPSSANQSYGPGNWGWLALGSGGRQLENNITSGCGCDVNVGDMLSPKTGESWGPVSKAVDALITNPGPAPTTLTGNESQLVTVPIVTPFTNGQTQVQVLGFAEVWLVSDISKNGNGQVLTVEFVKYIPNDGLAGGGPNDYGAYSRPVVVQ